MMHRVFIRAFEAYLPSNGAGFKMKFADFRRSCKTKTLQLSFFCTKIGSVLAYTKPF